MSENLYKDVTEKGNYIFLSYKRENIDYLRKIVPRFEFDTWYDFGIHYTEAWSEAIVNHIKNSSAVILFLSKELLGPGEESFPIYEYRIAVKNNKKVLVVYLDEIDYQDVPDSLAVWYEQISTKQCLVYKKERTLDELIADIHTAISDIAGSSVFSSLESARCTTGLRSKSEPVCFPMYSCSNFNSSIVYAGNRDAHLSQDMRKICLYNISKKMFEVHLMDNPGYILAAFKQTPEKLSNVKLFYTPNNSHMYHFTPDHIFIYDLVRGKWKDTHGTKFSLEKGESIVFVIQQKSGNQVYLLTQKNGFLAQMMLYDISENKRVQVWNLGVHRLKDALQYLNNNELNVVLFRDAGDGLRALDLDQLSFVDLPLSKIQQHYALEENRYSDVDQVLSHDGQIYGVRSPGSLQIFDTVSHHLIEEAFWGSFQDIYLLKNRTVLKYDLHCNVYQITSQGKKVLFRADDFQNNAYFQGNIPHTMFYDEINGNYIFVVSGQDGSFRTQKVIVVNGQKKVIRYSDPITIPFNGFSCQCSISRGELILLFSSDDAKLQRTFVFKGDYNPQL